MENEKENCCKENCCEEKCDCEDGCSCEALKSELAEKNEKINILEKQINSLSIEYVEKLKNKMEQANKMLDEKIFEITNGAKKEVNEIKKYAIEKDVAKLIEIIAQFELALSYESKDEKITNYKNGFKMFLTMFKSFLNDVGVNEVEIKIGDEFNPEIMECLDVVGSGEQKENHVTEIIAKCYKLHDRIVQVAKVKIAGQKN